MRSRRVKRPGRPAFRINRQLAYLKCGELAIRALAPGVHRRMRAIYDAIGPWLARRLRHPLAADAGYLALKPCEWFARAMLAFLVADPARWADRMYCRSADLAGPSY